MFDAAIGDKPIMAIVITEIVFLNIELLLSSRLLDDAHAGGFVFLLHVAHGRCSVTNP
jgi:hypothetical protein